MLFSCELDIPADYNETDLINLFCHIVAAIEEGKQSEEIVTYDGREVGSWECV